MNAPPETKTEFPVGELRSQYPALSAGDSDRATIFFDGPAGTQVPQSVAEAMSHSLLRLNANKGGLFKTSLESDRQLASAFQATSTFVGAADPDEIVFGQNMTSLTLALSRSLAQTWKPGDEIVVTELDHDANITPWVLAARDAGAHVRRIPFTTDDFSLDLDTVRAAIGPKTRLVAVCCASNATGGIQPVQEICSLARQVNAVSFLDAVHYGPHGLIDVAEWGCDFLVCSAYKFFGPHTGILWGKREWLESLPAFQVRPAPTSIPGKWMTGTQSHESIMGVKTCIEYLCSIPGAADATENPLVDRGQLRRSFEAIGRYERKLTTRMLEGLQRLNGIKIFGVTDPENLDRRFPTFAITHEAVGTTEIARALAAENIQVWHGHYYALAFVERLNLLPEGMVRIGLVHYNTLDEIDHFFSVLKFILKQ